MCGFNLSPVSTCLSPSGGSEFKKEFKDFVVTIFSQENLKTLILMSLKSDSVFLLKPLKYSQEIFNV